jgi:DNA topoisomerase-1
MKRLIIVESPVKAKTIQKLLTQYDETNEYCVKATVGHIKDLPKDKLGIEMKNGNFILNYVFIIGKKKLTDSFKKIKCDQILIASDNDKEGECCAHHLYNILNTAKNTNMNIKRMYFNEVTMTGIKFGIENLTTLNHNKVNAQQVRRAIDRIIGYEISKSIGNAIGRVQIAAMNVINSYKDTIKNIITTEGYFELLDGIIIKTVTNDIRDDWNCNAPTVIEQVKTYPVTRNAPKPFSTSSLLRECISQYGYQAYDINKQLQSLYEKGYITYHRTESTRISVTYLNNNGCNHVKETSKELVDAHECIRPTANVCFDSCDLNTIKNKIGLVAANVYERIWTRTYDALQPPDVYDEMMISIKHDNSSFTTHTRKLYKCEKGDMIKCSSIVEKKQLNVKELIDEARLLKELENIKVGRPSTLGTILHKLIDKKYVLCANECSYITPITISTFRSDSPPNVKIIEPAKGRNCISIRLSELGMRVFNKVNAMYPILVDLSFTQTLESHLDLIESGQEEKNEVINTLLEQIGFKL